MKHRPVLVIRNSIGQQILRQALKAGQNELDIDLSNYARGLYLYSLENINGSAITKKLSVN